MYLSPAVHELFAAQHGVISTRQLRESGLTRHQVNRLQRGGALHRVVRGAYRSPSVAFTELSRCAALCLAREDVAVSGPTAGRLWGFRRLPADRRVHVLAPPASNPAIAPWAVPYRTAAIHRDDVLDREDGIRITSRARTAFDLARWLPPDHLLSVIEQAMHDGRLDERDLRAVAVDWISPRRPWVRTFLHQLDRRVGGAPAESDPELRVTEALHRAGIRGLVRQFAIELPGYGSARFDIAVPHVRMAIEVDVHPSHEQTAGRVSDARRDRGAKRIGWEVHRISRTAYESGVDRAVGPIVERYRILRSATMSERAG